MNDQKKKGVILSYLSQIIQILSSLLYTPIMLRLLGQSEYGLYQLVYSVVSYLGLLSFGFSSSYMRFYARYNVKQDEKNMSKLNGMFLTIFLSISVICLFFGFLLVGNIKSVFSNGLTQSEYHKARILMIIMVINLAITFPNSVFDSIVSSKERFVFQKAIMVLQNVLNPFITLPLLVMGIGSIGMVLVTTALTISKLFINILYCKKNLKAQFCMKGFDFSLFKEMWGFTFFIFINMIVDQINWSVDKFLLGRYAGTIAVAIYGVGAQINSLYLQLSGSVSSVFIPKVNKIVAESDDNNVLSDLFIKVGRIQYFIQIAVLSTFLLVGREFIRVWAGENYYNSYYIAILLMLPVTVPLIQNLGIEIQRAKNKHKMRSIVYLFIATSNILVSIPCIIQWGERGAAIGTAITLLLGNGVFMNWYYEKKIGLNIKKFWMEIFKSIPALLLSMLVGFVLRMIWHFNSVLSVMVFCAVYVIVFVLLMYFLWLNEKEKQIMIQSYFKVKSKFGK